MPKRQVFYSFHYSEDDVWRVQQIRNMGVIEGNEPVSPNTWEEVKLDGKEAIKKWIDNTLKNRSCTIVLIGSETADREWVKYEIKKSWDDKKGLFGINIHNLKSKEGKKCSKGANPFGGPLSYSRAMSISVYDPSPNDAYEDIKKNIESWIGKAIEEAQNR